MRGPSPLRLTNILTNNHNYTNNINRLRRCIPVFKTGKGASPSWVRNSTPSAKIVGIKPFFCLDFRLPTFLPTSGRAIELAARRAA